MEKLTLNPTIIFIQVIGNKAIKKVMVNKLTIGEDYLNNNPFKKINKI